MSYLADVQMPSQEKEEIDLDTKEENHSFPDDEDQTNLEVSEEEDPLPAPIMKIKEKIRKEDIFKPKAPPAPKKVKISPVDEEIVREPILPKIAPVKKKRQMSEKQLEALARGRATRAAKKKASAPAPAPEPAPAPYQPDPVSVAYKEKKMNQDYQQQMYSKEDLQDMVYQGVQQYDTIRKKRKEKKKKAEAAASHEQKVFGDINSALNRTSDPWAQCFT